MVLLNAYPEDAAVAIVHTMAESFTDKMVEIYWAHRHKIPSPRLLERKKLHFLVWEKQQNSGQLMRDGFRSKAKGVLHFHGSKFVGKLKHHTYAPQGTDIHFDIPQGLRDGAPASFTWRWPVDAKGEKNRAEATWGRLQLQGGTPTSFRLSTRKGAAAWAGYDFWGEVLSKDQIKAKIRIDGDVHEIASRRRPPPGPPPIDFW